ncbi:MAG TPA: peptidylprolyl isomerase [Candidatus Omnitrophota bacterium]|nr:peptidylprolyl isomerase [Candidatus Omnitrophota bacterium]
MKIFSARRGALALGLIAGLAAMPAFAADKDPVVAVVNGTEIRASAVQAYQRNLPPQVAMQAPFEALLEIVINNHLVYEAAKKDNVQADPEIQELVRQFERQQVVKTWVGRKVRAEVTDEALKKAYDAALATYKPSEEVHARHVLTESEGEAKKIIGELKKGGDFAAIAKAKSIDPSAKQNGGDLGYFSKEEMVPQFAEAAFAMKPGEISAKPVKTQFGWHVIKVEDKRMSTPPTFDQAKPALRDQVADQTAERIVTDIRSKAAVKKFNADGSPMAEGEKK